MAAGGQLALRQQTAACLGAKEVVGERAFVAGESVRGFGRTALGGVGRRVLQAAPSRRRGKAVQRATAVLADPLPESISREIVVSRTAGKMRPCCSMLVS